MRTLLLVVVMLLVALAAGLSFVLPAGAQTPAPAATPGAVTLDASCDPPSVPVGVDSLITCMFIIRNRGGEVLPKAGLQFQPVADVSAVPPQRRYVFSERLDGVEQEVDPNGLSFFVGGIAPGGVRTAEFRIIVWSTYAFGADVVVVAGPDQREYARRTFRVSVVAKPLDVQLALKEERRQQSSSLWLVLLVNASGGPISGAEVEFEPGYRFSVEGGGFRQVPVLGGSGLYPRYVSNIGAIAPGVTEESISLQTAAGVCLTPNPAAVATVHLDSGTLVLAAIAVDAPSVCATTPQGVAPQGTAGLPSTGSGPSGADGRPPLPAALLAAVGLLSLAMGMTCRRCRLVRRPPTATGLRSCHTTPSRDPLASDG